MNRMVMTLHTTIVGTSDCPVIMAEWLEHWQLKSGTLGSSLAAAGSSLPLILILSLFSNCGTVLYSIIEYVTPLSLRHAQALVNF